MSNKSNPWKQSKSDSNKHRRRMAELREAELQRRQDQETATAAEAQRMIEEAEKASGRVICPLCKQPITVEDALRNMHTVTLNRKRMQVHKTCPTEVKGQ